jgi:DNA-binding PadR family transcriptional regulator
MHLRFVLLALLSKGPNIGYRLERELSAELDHLWGASIQQVYAELAKLEKDGALSVEYVDLQKRPTKKIYSLTPVGYDALDEWLLRRPASIQHKDDLLVKLYCLDRIPPEIAVRHLEERRDAHEAKVRELRRKLEDADGAGLGYRLTVEAALSHEQGQASWCTNALSHIQQSQSAGGGGLRESAM